MWAKLILKMSYTWWKIQGKILIIFLSKSNIFVKFMWVCCYQNVYYFNLHAEWIKTNRFITFLSICLFALAIATIALSSQKSGLEDELTTCRNQLTTTTTKIAAIIPTKPSSAQPVSQSNMQPIVQPIIQSVVPSTIPPPIILIQLTDKSNATENEREILHPVVLSENNL